MAYNTHTVNNYLAVGEGKGETAWMCGLPVTV